MAILFYVNNSIDNSPTESMKLMDYAKEITVILIQVAILNITTTTISGNELENL